jgi:hypothetical protein
MSENRTVRVSFRLDAPVHAAIMQLARDNSIETNAYIQRILKRHAAQSGVMGDAAREHVELSETIIEKAVKRARDLDEADMFDQHFVLTVFRDLMGDPKIRADYEKVVGGGAYQSGLPGKSPLNMYLGWYIKNAVGADPVLDANGNPRRTQVRNEPIQSYTLLTKPNHSESNIEVDGDPCEQTSNVLAS